MVGSIQRLRMQPRTQSTNLQTKSSTLVLSLANIAVELQQRGLSFFSFDVTVTHDRVTQSARFEYCLQQTVHVEKKAHTQNLKKSSRSPEIEI